MSGSPTTSGVDLASSSEGASVHDEFRYRLGQNIRKLRRARGLSQERLAEAVGLHRGTVYVLEAGRREPRAETLVRLSGALECNPNRFYEGIGWIPGPPASDGTFTFDSPGRNHPDLGSQQEARRCLS